MERIVNYMDEDQQPASVLLFRCAGRSIDSVSQCITACCVVMFVMVSSSQYVIVISCHIQSSTAQEHFAQGRDLAEARALPEDSRLCEANAEGFTSEEEHRSCRLCSKLQVEKTIEIWNIWNEYERNVRMLDIRMSQEVS